MTLLIVFGCIAACLTTYFTIGFGYIAPRWLAREVEKAIREWPRLAEDPDTVARWRREYAAMAWGPALAWPFYLIGRFITGRIAAASPLTAHELKLANDQQAKRIAELERELSIGKAP